MRKFAFEVNGAVHTACVTRKGFHKPADWVELKPDNTPEGDSEVWSIMDGVLALDPAKVEAHRANEVRKLRAAEYPPVTDQLDEIMKWLSTEAEIGIPPKLKSIACRCMAVKSKYPKNT